MTDYSSVAQKLGIKWHIGKYGFEFLPRDPSGRIYKLVSIVPLTGWTFDPEEIVKAIRLDDELGIKNNE